eukprot:g3356.t1
MYKRPLSPKSEIPPAHRHCQRLYSGSPVTYYSPCPDYIPTSVSPVYNPTTPNYDPEAPAYDPASRIFEPVYDPEAPAYDTASRIFDPVRKYHPTFDRTDVMSITYDVDYDPLRFAPIQPSKITTWTWPEFPKATRPQPPVPEFDDDVECSEVTTLCQHM